MDKLLRNKKAIVFFIAPAFLLFTLVLFVPICQSVYYSLCVLSSAALGLLWMFIFSPKLGINQILAQWGIQGPLWLMDVKGFINLPMKVIAFVALWQYVGQSMMLYMAQISGIDKSLYEASYIDGATKRSHFSILHCR